VVRQFMASRLVDLVGQAMHIPTGNRGAIETGPGNSARN